MKKLKAVLLAAVCLCLLGACENRETVSAAAKAIYYVSNSETKVEVRYVEPKGSTVEELVPEMLEYLGTTPEKLEYKAPLAMNFKLLGYTIADGKVTLDMDENYNSLSAYTEVLVRAALVRTLCQIDGVNYVAITVDGGQLFDGWENPVGLMNADQFIDNDGNEINTLEVAKLKLFFANESGTGLVSAYREKHYSSSTSLERVIVEELLLGPSGKVPGLYPLINPATKIINVTTKDGVCYVNLSEDFLTVVNNVPVEIAIYGIVDSLVEVSNINKVQILINGEVPASFSQEMYERNLDIVTALE